MVTSELPHDISSSVREEPTRHSRARRPLSEKSVVLVHRDRPPNKETGSRPRLRPALVSPLFLARSTALPREWLYYPAVLVKWETSRFDGRLSGPGVRSWNGRNALARLPSVRWRVSTHGNMLLVRAQAYVGRANYRGHRDASIRRNTYFLMNPGSPAHRASRRDLPWVPTRGVTSRGPGAARP
jgi:hypothetical protein